MIWMVDMLKQLHLKNWRSLRDVTIDFTPITVFIGANSSGKTNIIDALKFRRYVVLNGLRQANSRWNVFSEVITHGQYTDELIVEMLYLSPSGQEYPNQIEFKREKVPFNHTTQPDYRDDSAYHEPLARIFDDFIAKRIQILEEGFNPSIYQSRKLDQSLDLIDGQAGNMLAILDYMRNPQVAPEIYQKFSEDINYVLAHVDSIDVDNDGREFQLRIIERKLKALTISAGTARVAAMLTALHMLDIPPEKPIPDEQLDPGLVIIEEPDAALNPGVLENLVNVMRRFTEGDNPRQIILTTHNPTFLNYFKPEEVRVVERDDDGISQVYPVPHDILDDMEVIRSMGDMWLTRSLGGLG